MRSLQGRGGNYAVEANEYVEKVLVAGGFSLFENDKTGSGDAGGNTYR